MPIELEVAELRRKQSFDMEEEEFEEGLGLISSETIDHDENVATANYPQQYRNYYSSAAWRWWCGVTILLASAAATALVRYESSVVYNGNADLVVVSESMYFTCPALSRMKLKIGIMTLRWITKKLFKRKHAIPKSFSRK
jgi:hypothetical protein